MASNAEVKNLLRNAHLLPGLYKQHTGKEWDTNKPLIECAQALAKAGVTINRRGGASGGNGSGINVLNARRPASAVRGGIRDVVDTLWEQGKGSKTFNGNGQTITVNGVLNKTQSGFVLTATINGKSVEFTDHLDCAHAIMEAFDI